MKAGALHCGVEDRSQPWASRGRDLDYRNDGGTAVAEADTSVTLHGRGPSGGRDALYASLLKLLHFRKSLFLSWKRRS